MIRRGSLLLSLIAVCAPLGAASAPAERGRGGAVSAAEATATQAGVTLLQAGGNAVDAAVGTALALAVSHPEAGNLGGGGFAVVRFGDELTSLDFRETAPAAAHATMYLDEDGESIPDASTLGALAAGVPGTPRGLFALHERFGSLPWIEIVDPAYRLASEGFPVSRRLHEALARNQAKLARFPTTAAVWLPAGGPPPIGSTMRLPALAATLARYAAEGPAGITNGPVAMAVEETATASGGILTAADLGSYEPVWRPPVRFSAFGWEFASMDLPSSGGIILGQTLGILERLGWRDSPRFGADRAHLIAETWRLVFADRYLLGDPTTTKARAGDLLAPSWLDNRAGEVDRSRAASSDSVIPWSAPSPGALTESAETTHLSVVDGQGNIVAMTTTLNGSFGCGLLVPEAGFLLNNQMDDFATAPGRPNLYGLIQGEANAVGPGKRMLSSMSPTIAWDGSDVVGLGGRGGSRIPTATTQVILNLIVDGDDLQSAVNRPRLHHQWRPDRLEADGDALGPETAAELERRGHVLHFWPMPVKVHAVRHRADGTTEAAADPRGPGIGDVATREVPALARQGDSK